MTKKPEKASEHIARMIQEIGDWKLFPCGKANEGKKRKYFRGSHAVGLCLGILALSKMDKDETVSNSLQGLAYGAASFSMLTKIDGKILLAESIKYANEKAKEMRKNFVRGVSKDKNVAKLKNFALSIMKSATKKTENKAKSSQISRKDSRGGR
ncbi:MAG: hypothetical protein PHE89_06320 [Alphaproteobacteria bacterium]|nr:hypothetical protein [Alphaproteobacteria bacterium]